MARGHVLLRGGEIAGANSHPKKEAGLLAEAEDSKEKHQTALLTLRLRQGKRMLMALRNRKETRH